MNPITNDSIKKKRCTIILLGDDFPLGKVNHFALKIFRILYKLRSVQHDYSKCYI